MVQSSKCDDRKGKGPRIKKWIILEMIEACTCLTMRIFLGNKMEKKLRKTKHYLNIIMDHVKDIRQKRHH